jgi:hypothetical protein
MIRVSDKQNFIRSPLTHMGQVDQPGKNNYPPLIVPENGQAIQLYHNVKKNSA